MSLALQQNSKLDARPLLAGEGALWLAVLAHALVWVALPSLLEGSLRLDAAEGASGGPEWQLSYVRHPPFSEWLTALAWCAGPFRYAALFALSQALAAGSLLIVASGLRREHGAAVALIALMAGLASPFASYIPVQLNHNIGVMPFWALAILTARRAFDTDRIGPWLLFGLVVGCGLWAKYSILHIVAPLGVAFLFVPDWRRRLLSAGPWLAAALAVALIAPHAADVWSKGLTTLEHAARRQPMSWREATGYAFNLSFNALLLFGFASLPFVAAAGPRAFGRAIAAAFDRRSADRHDVFLNAAALGPLALVVLSPLVGIRPRPLWITPMIVPAVMWFGHALARTGELRVTRGVVAAAAMSLALAGGYAATILLPLQSGQPQYSTLDGRRFARLATNYWSEQQLGPIKYIVTTPVVATRHAAGSLAFDLPHRTHTFENASHVYSPWIDAVDLRRTGALVIGIPDIPEAFLVDGMEVVRRQTFERPVLRGRKRKPVTFGVVLPR